MVLLVVCSRWVVVVFVLRRPLWINVSGVVLLSKEEKREREREEDREQGERRGRKRVAGISLFLLFITSLSSSSQIANCFKIKKMKLGEQLPFLKANGQSNSSSSKGAQDLNIRSDQSTSSTAAGAVTRGK